jgi:hypothetical protein
MVETILGKFLVNSESAFLDTVNLQLLLMAIPNHITKDKVRRTHQFHFNVLEDSITKFLNTEPSEAFAFYDD